MLASFVEKLRIDVLRGGDVFEQAFEMFFHGQLGAVRVVGLDRMQDGLMLGDDKRDPSVLGQRQPTIAVDVDLHLLDEFPYPGISCNVGDCGVK